MVVVRRLRPGELRHVRLDNTIVRQEVEGHVESLTVAKATVLPVATVLHCENGSLELPGTMPPTCCCSVGDDKTLAMKIPFSARNT